MSQQGEAAEQIVNMATNVTVKGMECATNLAGNGALSLATFLIAVLKDQKRTNTSARSMLSNSEFIVMHNQAASDREKLAALFNISEQQMSYITNAEAGHGLMKIGNALVPFVNRFPKNTELYRKLTTKPGETELWGKSY